MGITPNLTGGTGQQQRLWPPADPGPYEPAEWFNYRLAAWARDEAPVTDPGERSVLGAVCSRARWDEAAGQYEARGLRVARIARDTGYHAGSVRDIVARLECAGILTRLGVTGRASTVVVRSPAGWLSTESTDPNLGFPHPAGSPRPPAGSPRPPAGRPRPPRGLPAPPYSNYAHARGLDFVELENRARTRSSEAEQIPLPGFPQPAPTTRHFSPGTGWLEL